MCQSTHVFHIFMPRSKNNKDTGNGKMSLVGPGQLVPYLVNSALNWSYPPVKSAYLWLKTMTYRYFWTTKLMPENCRILCIETRLFPADLTLKIRCILCVSTRNTWQSMVLIASTDVPPQWHGWDLWTNMPCLSHVHGCHLWTPTDISRPLHRLLCVDSDAHCLLYGCNLWTPNDIPRLLHGCVL